MTQTLPSPCIGDMVTTDFGRPAVIAEIEPASEWPTTYHTTDGQRLARHEFRLGRPGHDGQAKDRVEPAN